jgi:2-haloacid dehalogenase
VTAAPRVVFFDLFGTLVSLTPLDAVCDRLAPSRGAEIAARWRARQLEASWLRTAMNRWADFDVVTLDALRDTLDELGIEVPPDVASVADAFVELPLVNGAGDAVRGLRAAGLATGIISNASTRMLDRTVPRLGIDFDHVLSVDGAAQFKPHPSVYQLAVDGTGFTAERIGFVTANGWDAAGAAAFGLQVAWLRPSASATLPSVGAPEPVVTTWADLPAIFGTRLDAAVGG